MNVHRYRVIRLFDGTSGIARLLTRVTRNLMVSLPVVGWLTLSLLSCQASPEAGIDRWSTYHNDRFGYEFPYPQGWVMTDAPENRDGIILTQPNNTGIEIRGAASFIVPLPDNPPQGQDIQPIEPASIDKNSPSAQYQIEPASIDKNSPSAQYQGATTSTNFTTAQQVNGMLGVTIAEKFSSLRLTIQREGLSYVWMGSAPSDQFQTYYQLFNSIAKRYTLPDRDSAPGAFQPKGKT